MKRAVFVLVSLALALGCSRPRELAAAPLALEPLEAPYVHVSNVVPLDSTVFEQRMRIDLRVQNPNDFALQFSGLRFDLEVNGEPFAKGLTDAKFTIPRLQQAVVAVITTTTFLDLVRQIQALDTRESLGYRISGRFFLAGPDAGNLDFERTGRLVGSAKE